MRRGFSVVVRKPGVEPEGELTLLDDFRRKGWTVCHQSPAFTVLILGNMAFDKLKSAGVIVGEAFARYVPDRALDPAGIAAGAILDNLDQKRLHETTWGSYFLIAETTEHLLRCYRSPNSSLHAFFVEFPWGTAVLSHMPGWFRGSYMHAPVDVSSLAAQLARPSLEPHESCIPDVRSLLGGRYYDIHPGQITEHEGWKPAAFCDDELSITALPEAVELTRREILRCVGGWCGTAERAQLDLSGGLDSSIIAGAARRPLCCVNFLYEGSDADERTYAAVVAEQGGHMLTVTPIDPKMVDINASASRWLPWPAARSYVQEAERIAVLEREQTEATLFLSGAGGDHVFCALQSTAPIFDAVRQTGVWRGLSRTAWNVAEAANANIWHVAAATLRRTLRLRRMPREDYSMLSAAAIEAVNARPWHPWLQGIRRLPRGKVEHIAALIRAENDAAGFGRGVDYPLEFPLLSQPLVEVCLRIPTWLWLHGGADRAIARKAMSDLLPRAISSRRSKGGFNRFHRDVYLHHRQAVIALVMDGLLRRAGILDERQLSLATSEQARADPAQFLRLMRIADIEAWAAAWR